MSLCPEAEMRAAMTDGEFWEHVLGNGSWYEPEPYDPRHDALDAGLIATPCSECGAAGACGWDDEGRPLIHATEGQL